MNDREAVVGHHPSGSCAGEMTVEPMAQQRPGSATLVVLAYNHAEYVTAALDAISVQLHPDLQVIIFDDVSSDGTADVIEEYLANADLVATFIRHSTNKGLCATLNEALELIETEFVAFISADDWIEPDRFVVQVAQLTKLGPEYGMIYSDAHVVDRWGDRQPRTYYDIYSSDVPGPDTDFFLKLIDHNIILAPSVLFRAAVFSRVGKYDEDLPYEDYDMWLRISRQFKIAFSPDVVVNYRDTPGSLSKEIQTDLRDVAVHRKAALKHLGQSRAIDRVIRKRVTALSKELYRHGGPARQTRRDLYLGIRDDHHATTLLYLAAAGLGVPGSWFGRVVGVAQIMKSAGRGHP